MWIWGKSTVNSSKYIEYFNQQNCGQGIYDCGSVTESKLEKKISIQQHYKTNNLCVFESNWLFGNINHLTECKTFENISIGESHRIKTKWIEWKIFELEYGNRKPLNVWKDK